MTALVTGSGLVTSGKPSSPSSVGEGFDVQGFDLVSGFDVSDPEVW